MNQYRAYLTHLVNTSEGNRDVFYELERTLFKAARDGKLHAEFEFFSKDLLKVQQIVKSMDLTFEGNIRVLPNLSDRCVATIKGW